MNVVAKFTFTLATAFLVLASESAVAAGPPITRVPVEGIKTPIILIPQGALNPTQPDLESLKRVPIPAGPVVLDPAPPAAAPAPAGGDCGVAQLRCASALCYPLGPQWSSYRQCLATECRIEQQDCISALAEILEERR